jgi:hypothetical protein
MVFGGFVLFLACELCFFILHYLNELYHIYVVGIETSNLHLAM